MGIFSACVEFKMGFGEAIIDYFFSVRGMYLSPESISKARLDDFEYAWMLCSGDLNVYD